MLAVSFGEASEGQTSSLCRLYSRRACKFVYTGFIRVREMSGKLKNFQGQGIVREFHNPSGKIEFLLKCQGILEFQMKFRFSNKKKYEEKY